MKKISVILAIISIIIASCDKNEGPLYRCGIDSQEGCETHNRDLGCAFLKVYFSTIDSLTGYQRDIENWEVDSAITAGFNELDNWCMDTTATMTNYSLAELIISCQCGLDSLLYQGSCAALQNWLNFNQHASPGTISFPSCD